MKGNKFNYVINLAARAHIRILSDKGNNFIEKLSNIEKSVNSFDPAKVKLIHLSSAKVKLNKNNSL